MSADNSNAFSPQNLARTEDQNQNFPNAQGQVISSVASEPEEAQEWQTPMAKPGGGWKQEGTPLTIKARPEEVNKILNSKHVLSDVDISDPDNARVFVANFLNSKYNENKRGIYKDFEGKTKTYGLSGDPVADAKAIKDGDTKIHESSLTRIAKDRKVISEGLDRLEPEETSFLGQRVRAVGAGAGGSLWSGIAGFAQMAESDIEKFKEAASKLTGIEPQESPEGRDVLGMVSEFAGDVAAVAPDAFGVTDETRQTFSGQFAEGAGQLIGQAAVSVVSPTAGIVMMAGQMEQEALIDAEETFGKKYEDFTKLEMARFEDMRNLYVLGGTALEKVGVMGTFKKLFKLNKAVKTDDLVKSFGLMQFSKEFTKGFLVEGGTEAAQGQLKEALAAHFYDSDRELFTEEQFNKRMMEFAVGGLLGGSFRGGISATTGASKALKKFMDPEEGMSQIDMALAANVVPEPEFNAYIEETYGDQTTEEGVPLQELAIKARQGDRKAAEELVEALTVEASQAAVEAGLTAEEAEARGKEAAEVADPIEPLVETATDKAISAKKEELAALDTAESEVEAGTGRDVSDTMQGRERFNPNTNGQRALDIRVSEGEVTAEVAIQDEVDMNTEFDRIEDAPPARQAAILGAAKIRFGSYQDAILKDQLRVTGVATMTDERADRYDAEAAKISAMKKQALEPTPEPVDTLKQRKGLEAEIQALETKRIEETVKGKLMTPFTRGVEAEKQRVEQERLDRADMELEEQSQVADLISTLTPLSEGSTVENAPDLSGGGPAIIQGWKDAGFTKEEIEIKSKELATQQGMPNVRLEDMVQRGSQKSTKTDGSPIQSLIRLFKGANPFTVVEEFAHAEYDREIANGTVTVEQIREWRKAIEELTSTPDLRGETDEDIKEWVAEQVKARIYGQRNDLSLPESFKKFLDDIISKFKQILGRAAELKDLDAKNQLPEGFLDMLDRQGLVGNKQTGGTASPSGGAVDTSTDSTFSLEEVDANRSVSESVYLRNSSKFQEKVDNGTIKPQTPISTFTGSEIFLHAPDFAFAGTASVEGQNYAEGKGGVYYPVLFDEGTNFWASTRSAAKKMASDLNKIGEKNDGKILMGLVSSPADKMFSSTTISRSVVKFFNIIAENPRKYGIKKPDLNRLIVAASKSAKDKGKTFKRKLKVGTGLDGNVTEIQDLLNADDSTFGLRKSFVEELAAGIAGHLKSQDESKSSALAGALLGAENLHAKKAIVKGKLSKASILQGLGEQMSEGFTKGLHEIDSKMIYAVIEYDGKVEAVATPEHESYPYAIRGMDGGDVVVNVLDKAHPWNEAVEYSEDVEFKDDKNVVTSSYKAGESINPDDLGRVMPASAGVTFKPLRVVEPSADSTSIPIPSYSLEPVSEQDGNPDLGIAERLESADVVGRVETLELLKGSEFYDLVAEMLAADVGGDFDSVRVGPMSRAHTLHPDSRGHYDPNNHTVAIGLTGDDATLAHEIAHALTSRKIKSALAEKFGQESQGKVGEDYLEMLRAIPQKLSKNDPLAVIVNSYLKAFDQYIEELGPHRVYNVALSGELNGDAGLLISSQYINELEGLGAKRGRDFDVYDDSQIIYFDKSFDLLDGSSFELNRDSSDIELDEETGGETEIFGIVTPSKAPREWESVVGLGTGMTSKRIAPYGLSNLDEFIAETFSNREFQKRLMSIKSEGLSVSLWDKMVGAISKILRLETKGTLLEDVIRSTGEFIKGETNGEVVETSTDSTFSLEPVSEQDGDAEATVAAEERQSRTPERQAFVDYQRELRRSQTDNTEEEKEKLQELLKAANDADEIDKLKQEGDKKLIAVIEKKIKQIRKQADEREDVTESVKALERLINSPEVPMEVRARMRGFGRLTERKTPQGKARWVEHMSNKLEAEIDRHYRTRNVRTLRSLLRPFATEYSPNRRKLKERVGEEARSELNFAQRLLNNSEATPPVDITDERRNELIDIFGDVGNRQSSPTRVKAALNIAGNIAKEGRTARDDFKDQRRERNEKLGDLVREEVLNGEKAMGKSQIAAREKQRNVFMRGYDFFRARLVHGMDGLQQQLNKLDSIKGGILESAFLPAVYQADQNEKALNREHNERVDKDFKTVLGSDDRQAASWYKNSRELHDTDIEWIEDKAIGMEKRTISKQQGVSVLMQWLDPSLRPTFSNMGINEATIEQIKEFIGEIGVSEAYYFRERYAEMGIALNAKHMEVEGIPLDMIDGYGGRARRINSVGSRQEDMQMFSTDSSGRPTVKSGSMKERTNSTDYLIFQDASSDFAAHAKEVNHYISHAELAKNLSAAFLNNAKARNAIKQKHGAAFYKSLSSQIEAIIEGDPKFTEGDDQFVNSVRANITKGSLMAKPAILIKQLTSAPAFVEEIGPVAYAKAATSLTRNARKFMPMIWNSEYVKNRMSNSQYADIQQSLDQRDNTLKGLRWDDYAMMNVKWGDIGAVIAGGAPVYVHAYNEAKAANMTDDQAQAKAEEVFGLASERAQQSSATHAKGLWLRSTGILRSWFMYITSPMQYQRNVNAGIANLVANVYENKSGRKSEVKKAANQALRAIVIYHVILPQIFQAVASGLVGFTDDEDYIKEQFWAKQRRALIIGNLNTFPALGQLISVLANKASGTGEFFSSSGSPVVDLVGNIATDFHRATKDPEDLSKWMDLAGELALSKGIPVKTAKSYYDAITDISEGNTKHPFLRAGGWSKWSTFED